MKLFRFTTERILLISPRFDTPSLKADVDLVRSVMSPMGVRITIRMHGFSTDQGASKVLKVLRIPGLS